MLLKFYAIGKCIAKMNGWLIAWIWYCTALQAAQYLWAIMIEDMRLKGKEPRRWWFFGAMPTPRKKMAKSTAGIATTGLWMHKQNDKITNHSNSSGKTIKRTQRANVAAFSWKWWNTCILRSINARRHFQQTCERKIILQEIRKKKT